MPRQAGSCLSCQTLGAQTAMREIRDTVISGRATESAYGNAKLDKVTFEACYVPRQEAVGSWTVLSNAALEQVTHINCDIHTSAIQEVSLNGLTRHGSDPVFFWGCVFKHVTLRGKISGIKINRSISALPTTQESAQADWDQKVQEFYRSVDWALDISAAKFPGGVTFEAIPGSKIRINRESQALVKREALLSPEGQNFDFGNSSFKIALGWFQQRSLFDSVVLVARSDSKYAKQDIAMLTALRSAGIAE